MERLRAVTRLEQEGAALGHLGERLAELPCLAREYEWWQRVQPAAHLRGTLRIGPYRLLERLALAPGGWGPDGVEDGHTVKCRDGR